MVQVVVSNLTVDIEALDKQARAHIGVKCVGVSDGNRIILADDATPQDIAKAEAVFENWASLSPSTDKTSVDADGVDTATITLNSADVTLDYMVIKDGVVYGSGTAATVAGVLTLEFATDEPGIYRIYVFRTVLDHGCGFVDVEALEV